jgi:hypothetical protein
MRAHEERFARVWLEVVGDANLFVEVHNRQHQLLAMPRTASRHDLQCLGGGRFEVFIWPLAFASQAIP